MASPIQTRYEFLADDRTKAAFASIQSSFSGLRTAAVSVGPAITAALSFGAVTASIKNVAEYQDQMGKLSQKAGITAEQMSALGYAGKLADVEVGALSKGIYKLSRLAAEGDPLLAKLGISTKTAGGEARDIAAILGDVSNIFQVLPDGVTKTALAQELLGKGGANLIPLLNGGAAGLKSAMEEAKKFGIVVDGEAAKAAERFNDNLTRLAEMSKGTAIAIAGPLVESIGKATDAYIENAKQGEKMLGVYKAMQVFLTGDDRYKNDKERVKLTDDLIRAENQLSLKRSQRAAPGIIAQFEAEVKSIKERLATSQAYAKVLGEEADAEKQKQAIASAGLNPDFIAKWEQLSSSYAKGAISVRQLTAAQKELLSQQTAVKMSAIDFDKILSKPGAGGKKTESVYSDVTADLNGLLQKYDQLNGSASEYGRIVRAMDSNDKPVEFGQYMQVAALAEYIDKEKQRQKTLQDSIDATVRNNAALVQYIESVQKENDEIEKSNKSKEQENEEIGLTTQQLSNLKLARIDANIAAQEENLIRAQNIDGNELEIAQIERRINLLRVERGLTKAGGDAVVKVELDKEAKAAADSLYGDVKGALANAFRDSKGNVLQSFGDALGNVVFTRLSTAMADALLSNVFGSSIFKSIGISSLFGFANGGIMASSGPLNLPMRTYADGGVVSSPQVRVAGEGSMNEAIIPLPDGRTVPVTMVGGARQGRAINITINNTIGSVASQADVVSGMRVVRQQIMGELARAKTYGRGG